MSQLPLIADIETDVGGGREGPIGDISTWWVDGGLASGPRDAPVGINDAVV